MDLELRDKVALVAAASRGLGKAAALALAREGASVAVCSRGEQILATQAEIESQTGRACLGVIADLTRPADIDRLVRETLAHFGRIDILILNAGGPPPGGFMALGDAEWQEAFNLTVMSAVRLCRAVLPAMLERGSGSIVASLSYSVKQPIDNLILSNSLRLAVIGMLKSLAAEVGRRGVRVNAINPGWTWTERVQTLLDDRARRAGTTVEAEQAKLAAEIPLGRMGTVEEYGKVVAWLASPAASYIHGQAIFFDGGITRASL
jgi:3-oxoacyl-[acyl-carrier protein] reductase